MAVRCGSRGGSGRNACLKVGCRGGWRASFLDLGCLGMGL